MDSNQNISLFDLSVDSMSKSHLFDAARWGRFLAIVGFVMTGLVIILFPLMILRTPDPFYYKGKFVEPNPAGPEMLISAILTCVLLALIYFFPCLYLFRFSTRMKRALITNDQNTLNSSFKNLKSLFRFVGILTLIFVILFGMSSLITLVSALTTG